MTTLMTKNGIIETVEFDLFRITQVPAYTGSSTPTGCSGALSADQMAEHIRQFEPVWKDVVANQSWPLNIRILGRYQGEWYTATMLSPGALRPITKSFPSLEELGLTNSLACPGCGGDAGEYVENRCCACDSERRFNLSDIEWVQELCIQHMDRNPSVNVPVSMIDRVKWVDGGWDIHCDNGHNYRIEGNLLYDIGSDACPMPRAQRSVGMTI